MERSRPDLAKAACPLCVCPACLQMGGNRLSNTYIPGGVQSYCKCHTVQVVCIACGQERIALSVPHGSWVPITGYLVLVYRKAVPARYTRVIVTAVPGMILVCFRGSVVENGKTCFRRKSVCSVYQVYCTPRFSFLRMTQLVQRFPVQCGLYKMPNQSRRWALVLVVY